MTAGPIVCFGEIMLRLAAPGRGHLLQEARLDATFGGAEANVAVALARIGVPAAFVTALPDGPLGEAALDSVRRAGVDATGVVRRAGRLGLYFLSPGAGPRAASILYDRADSVFAQTPSAAYDWPRLLAGARWLHLSGIIPALGPEAARLSLDAIAAAREAGVRVSFDGNYRASLWARWCADPAPILAEHVAGADLLFGSHRDVSLLLGTPFAGDGPERRREAALAAFERFPTLRAIASTARHLVTAETHRLSARVDRRDDAHETAEVEVAGIVDRIGTGDAFAAGVLARLDDGPEAAASAGLALAALNHATFGDQSFTTADEMDAFEAGVLDVRR
ncbi:MAG: sugar kinase [Janthinobacterium lividum]